MELLNTLTVNATKIEKITIVMRVAHKLFKAEDCFKTWSETLKQAWAMLKDKMIELRMLSHGKHVCLKDLNVMLISDVVEFGYIKKDGSFRIFRATKNFDIIPAEHHPISNVKSTNLRFFDVEANGWRGLIKGCEYVYML